MTWCSDGRVVQANSVYDCGESTVYEEGTNHGESTVYEYGTKRAQGQGRGIGSRGRESEGGRVVYAVEVLCHVPSARLAPRRAPRSAQCSVLSAATSSAARTTASKATDCGRARSWTLDLGPSPNLQSRRRPGPAPPWAALHCTHCTAPR